MSFKQHSVEEGRQSYIWSGSNKVYLSENSSATLLPYTYLVLLVVEVGANVNTGGERVLGLEHQWVWGSVDTFSTGVDLKQWEVDFDASVQEATWCSPSLSISVSTWNLWGMWSWRHDRIRCCEASNRRSVRRAKLRCFLWWRTIHRQQPPEKV